MPILKNINSGFLTVCKLLQTEILPKERSCTQGGTMKLSTLIVYWIIFLAAALVGICGIVEHKGDITNYEQGD